jgi:hypothetical protein
VSAQASVSPHFYIKLVTANPCPNFLVDNEPSCGQNGQLPPAEDFVFLQNEVTGLTGCQDLDVGPFAATYFYESSKGFTPSKPFY